MDFRSVLSTLLKRFDDENIGYAFREASGKMLDRAVEKDIFDEKIRIKVLRPEDIIGLKLQALNNDPGRKEVDMQDVRELMAVQKGNLDLALVEEYFNLFGLEEVYRELIEQK